MRLDLCIFLTLAPSKLPSNPVFLSHVNTLEAFSMGDTLSSPFLAVNLDLVTYEKKIIFQQIWSSFSAIFMKPIWSSIECYVSPRLTNDSMTPMADTALVAFTDSISASNYDHVPKHTHSPLVLCAWLLCHAAMFRMKIADNS